MVQQAWKDYVFDKFPECKEECNSVKAFAKMRSVMREFEVDTYKKELTDGGFIEGHYLTTGVKPFNVFARVGAGVMVQDNMKQQQKYLGNYQDRFVVACNRPENDEHWSSHAEEWVGKASMSQRHQFLIIKGDKNNENRIHWQWFNALTFGLLGGVTGLKVALDMIISAKGAALNYTRKDKGWSSKVGLYLHCSPFNSVNHFHLHMVDLTTVGPTYGTMVWKNLPIDHVITVLWYEIHDQAAWGYSRVSSPLPPMPKKEKSANKRKAHEDDKDQQQEDESGGSPKASKKM